MNYLELTGILNFLIALSTLPSAVFILITLIKEERVVNIEARHLNSLLRTIFFSIAIGALINVMFSIFRFTQFPLYSDMHPEFVSTRNLFTNTLFCFATWGIYLLQRKTRR
jgi:hypothetical protein